MAYDNHANFAVSLVATAPSPATSGTSLVITAGQGAWFPAAPFNAVAAPPNTAATPSNAEIVRVTAISTDTFTITRAQEGTSAQAISVGWQFYAAITKKTLTDFESTIEQVATVGTSGAAQTIPDVTTATVNVITLTANCTFTFPTAGLGKGFSVALVQGGTGSFTATWPGTVKWSGGVAPALTTTVGKTDLLSFICVDGTNWLGALSGANF